MQFRTEVLDNGLEVVAEINPDAFSMSIGYFVKTGSRDETHEIAGVSHFLEHMMFKGTARRTSVDVNRELDDLGSPSLRDEDFQTEKQVILEEIAMYDDQPPYGAMERAMEAYFGSHPLATRVLGTRDTVTALTSEAMRTYHEARYAPNNLCLVATGAVDFDALVKETATRTKSWKASNISRELGPPKVQSQTIGMVHPPATQQYTLEFSPGPGYLDPDRYVTRVLGSILGDDTGSRLFWDLVDTGLADTAVAYTQEFQDCGVFGIFLACAPDQQTENWARIEAILASALESPVTERELDLAKNKICAGMILASERPSNRLFSVGNAWTIRRKYEGVRDAAEHYRQVSLDQVQQAFLKLKDRQRVLVSVGPE